FVTLCHAGLQPIMAAILPCRLFVQNLNSRGRSRNGLSRKGSKGGSMGERAGKLGQLLKRCYRDNIDPVNLDDKVFRDYITEIREEPADYNPAQSKKSQNSVIATGKVWLDFLVFIGTFYRKKNHVSETGAIHAREETYYIRVRGGKKIAKTYLWHYSFGKPRREHDRDPVTSEQIQTLRAANRRDRASDFVKARRLVMIELFTDLGPRRRELTNLKVQDVRDALRLENPVLRLDTLKREEGAQRFVPILAQTLRKLDQFIDGPRRKTMRQAFKGGMDHGYFFVSSRTGKPVSDTLFSNEILRLRKLAGIPLQVCPHMFRHAMITRLFTQFIARHELNNSDDFRRALLDTETFKAEIVQWTGHLDHTSVERYIHLAFRDLSSYTETLSSVHLTIAMDKYFALENDLKQQLKEGLPINEYIEQMNELEELYKRDAESAKKRTTALNTPQ
ncbi:tyrosine-type recombinase/integrase, partial [Pseudomonas bohemica]|uniref:tyrosine-type recombinase/integrase n=1 Tax=Pseudomonas bohemica TaxID=2044872 RepID=UPI000DA5F31D